MMASSSGNVRQQHEIEHGKYLSTGLAEHTWGWGTPAGQLRAQRRAALIPEGARIGPSNKVMEVGCGTGLFTATFARSGARIITVDVSADLLAIARKRNLPNVEFLERSFEDCKIEGPFDAIIGGSVLHHLDLERTWPKLFSLLKPGGRMSFAEPNVLNPQIYCERHFRRFFPQVSLMKQHLSEAVCGAIWKRRDLLPCPSSPLIGCIPRLRAFSFRPCPKSGRYWK